MHLKNSILFMWKFALVVHGLLATLLIYGIALLLYPYREHVLKAYSKLMMRIWFRAAGIKIVVTGSERIQPEGNLFVAGKNNVYINMLLHVVLPDNTYHFWSSTTLPGLLFWIMQPFMALPLDNRNLTRQKKQIAAIETKKHKHNFSTLINDKLARQLTREMCSTGAAYIAIENKLAAVPVSVHIVNNILKFDRSNPLIIRIHLGDPIGITDFEQTKADRARLTDGLFQEIKPIK